ncbi:hypothetical protein [Nodosilinea sp. LEGE 06152]|nr:hypothetical protein [Nodosilinea sp. LEGE 06152]
MVKATSSAIALIQAMNPALGESPFAPTNKKAAEPQGIDGNTM